MTVSAHKRLSLIASLLYPGMGHVFAGRTRKVILFPTLLMMSVALMMFLLPLVPTSIQFAFFVLGLLSTFGIYVWTAVDSYRTDPSDLSRKRRLLLLLLLVGLVSMEGSVLSALQELWIEPYYMPSKSMIPTLLPGDRFYISKGTKARTVLSKGDVVAFRSPVDPEVIYIKRIVAITGEQVLVQGDNTELSFDSRQYGAIPITDIIGKPLFVWLSLGTDPFQIRWDRFGKPIE